MKEKPDDMSPYENSPPPSIHSSIEDFPDALVLASLQQEEQGHLFSMSTENPDNNNWVLYGVTFPKFLSEEHTHM